MPSGLVSLRLMFERSKSESLRDVGLTRIGDTLFFGFMQTELKSFMKLIFLAHLNEHISRAISKKQVALGDTIPKWLLLTL